MGRYSDLVAADGAVAYWRLGELSGTTAADSIGSRNGTIAAGVTLNQVGAIEDGNKAMAFDGATGHYVNVPGMLSYPIPAAIGFSIECWIKTTDSAAGGGQFFVDTKTAGSANAGFALSLDATHRITFRLSNGVTSGSITGNVNTLNNGAWRHVIGVMERLYDGVHDRVRVFVDGVLDNQSDVGTAGLDCTPSTALAIGSYSAGGASPNNFIGSVDDVAFYPVALTATQVSAHAAAGPPIGYTKQVIADGASAYWRLQETSGTSAVDSIAGANGTISGGVTLNVPGPYAGSVAYRFNGSTGRVTVATGTYQTFGTGPVTLECWVRYLGGGNQDVVDMKGAGSSVAGIRIVTDTSPGLYGQVSDGTTLWASAVGVPTLFTDLRWRHLVAVVSRTANTITLYSNGVAIGPVTAITAGVNIGTTAATELGGYAGTIVLNGDLAEVAVYKAALTPAQIANHYNLGTGGQGGTPAELRTRYRWRDAA